jgi:hypothetical protein
MIEESKFHRIYQKEIRPVFFPAYHAHGRADAAGSEDKKYDVLVFRNCCWCF